MEQGGPWRLKSAFCLLPAPSRKGLLPGEQGLHTETTFVLYTISSLGSTLLQLLCWFGFPEYFSDYPPSLLHPTPAGAESASVWPLPLAVAQPLQLSEEPHFPRPISSAAHKDVDWMTRKFFYSFPIPETYNSTFLKKNKKGSVTTKDFQPALFHPPPPIWSLGS